MKISWFQKGKTRISIRPVTWQGWLVVLIFVSLTIYNFFRLDANSQSLSDTLIDFVPQSLFLILLYFLTANNLTGDEKR